MTDLQFWLFVAIGFVAQLFDSGIGMGFGAISSTVLAALGLPREVVSASVNGAKLFAGIASGISHIALKNIDWRILRSLLIAGTAGGMAGAWFITTFDGRWVGVGISLYLLLVGLFLLWRAYRPSARVFDGRGVATVGIAGGFLQAVAGVWGPLVTSNLVALGVNPRGAIGTGNVAEMFIAGIVFAVLIAQLGIQRVSYFGVALLAGALLAAPLGAVLARELPRRTLTILVGLLVTLLSGLRLYHDAIG
ncbi:MAG: sulfite exporter TauE/SafE family protein [Steroidobacteraceae bacterium]